MKKIFAMFSILVLLTGCTSQNVKEGYPIDEFLQSLVDEELESGFVFELLEDQYVNFGIDETVEVKQAYMLAGISLQSKTILILEVDDPVKVRQAISEYNQAFLDDQFNQGYYNDIEIRQNSIIDSYGNYVYLVASEKGQEIVDKFKETVTE